MKHLLNFHESGRLLRLALIEAVVLAIGLLLLLLLAYAIESEALVAGARAPI